MILSYVTYDSDTGELTGSYLQQLQSEHVAHHIAVDDETRAAWLSLRANATRDGVEPRLPAELPSPTEAQIVGAYMAAVQQHMDARAVEFGYDDLISVVTYAEEPAVARYQAEGQAFRAWRSACWFACEEMLAAVKAGNRPAPTHAALLAELPALGIEYSGPFA